MEPYQERVVVEAHELADKVEKLGAFIDSPACAKVPTAEQNLLHQQLEAMQEYLAILGSRIALWGPPVVIHQEEA